MEYKYHPETKEELKELVKDESIYLGDIDTSNITDMNHLFHKSTRRDFSGIEKWDTSNVTNMSGMFFECEKFNQPVPFDTSKVTHMSWMFFGCHEFNQPLEFDTSNVENMHVMFAYCHKFNQPLEFDTSKVKDMGMMFFECEKFNQPVPFDTSNVKNMLGMFEGCKEFNQPLKFDTSNVTGRREMFIGCHNLPLATQAKVELGISDVTRGEPGIALKDAKVLKVSDNYTALKKGDDTYVYSNDQLHSITRLIRGEFINLSWPEGAPTATVTPVPAQKLAL
ncbi:BspA family leucine-rich repeat surface protein [Jonquetella anthropi]|uniref:BspA family leucine-rich repeat surface protein n=1 Tax=Jonquetella anthropi TaxID=428712 RepID=UPI0001B91204|nr:BspA family leucine-rich repeat surface protein [Jonquetella anthropi]EEX47843.1 bacterial surface protein 26-residue PARCEL repeat (3 repeats) [Jonquetella anthropi E3_33 E1]